MSVRIVTCIDLPTDDPAEAYAMLYRALRDVEEKAHAIEGWESSNEWYDSEGRELSEAQVCAARQQHFHPDEATA